MDWSKYLFTMEYDAYHGDGSVIHRLSCFPSRQSLTRFQQSVNQCCGSEEGHGYQQFIVDKEVVDEERFEC